MSNDNVKPFGKSKIYTHFGELLKDAAKDCEQAKCGIIILFDDNDDAIKVWPIAKPSQVALAAANLLRLASAGCGNA